MPERQNREQMDTKNFKIGDWAVCSPTSGIPGARGQVIELEEKIDGTVLAKIQVGLDGTAILIPVSSLEKPKHSEREASLTQEEKQLAEWILGEFQTIDIDPKTPELIHQELTRVTAHILQTIQTLNARTNVKRLPANDLFRTLKKFLVFEAPRTVCRLRKHQPEDSEYPFYEVTFTNE